MSATSAPEADAPAASAPGTGGARSRGARDTVRRWRWPVGLALLVLAAGAVIALLQPSSSSRYLDPASTGSDGGHALADLLASRGQQVIRETAGTAANAKPGVELVTGADQLSRAQLIRAARFPGDIVVTDPDPAALRALAPAVTTDAGGQAGALTAPPLCNDPTANLAGNIDAGGAVLRTDDPAAAACYPVGGGYLYVRYRDKSQDKSHGTSGGRTVTVLGTSEPFTDAELADNGDASLALNLLRGSHGAPAVTWLLPEPGAVPAGQSRAQRGLFGLVPWPVYLIAIQLTLAVVLAAAWRARRLGPLVAERIPVIVRASETVEGHGRLYTARRARDRAAAELRAAAGTRIARRTGTVRRAGIPQRADGPGEADARAVAARVGEDPDRIASLLGGPAPATDHELVALADDLDQLERKVRHL